MVNTRDQILFLHDTVEPIQFRSHHFCNFKQTYSFNLN